MSAVPSRPVRDVFEWHRELRGRAPATSLALALVLSSRMDPDGSIPGRFTPSIETLSIDLGYAPNSRRGVIRAMRELEARGFLEVQRQGTRKPNRYRATVPAVATPPHSQVADEPAAGGPRATPPTPPSQIPTQVRPASPEQARELAGELLREVCLALPQHEGDAIWFGIDQLRERSRLRDYIADLVLNGYGPELIGELTRPLVTGTTPYSRVANPPQALWARTRHVHARHFPGSRSAHDMQVGRAR